MAEFDAIVVGGGPVGSALACGLGALGLGCALVEREPSAPSADGRSLALARSSVNTLGGLGVWPQVAAVAAPIRRVVVSAAGAIGQLRLDAGLIGADALGQVVPAEALAAAWQRTLATCAGLTRVSPGRCVGLHWRRDRVHVDVVTPRGERTLSAQLVVGADGSDSTVRRLAGIGHREYDYPHAAVVTRVRCERPHPGVAFERLTGEGPLAVMPRADGLSGLIWGVHRARVEAVLALADDAFCAAAAECFGRRLGRFTEPAPRVAWPLRQVRAQRLVRGRVVLVGNAAQTVHPNGAQGLNLGLRDVATLLQLIADARDDDADPGAPMLLARYARRRRPDRERVLRFTDALARHGYRGPLAAVRGPALALLERGGPVKQRFAARMAGAAGWQPRLARGAGL